jgi:molybdopterin biosynthesis enzyme
MSVINPSRHCFSFVKRLLDVDAARRMAASMVPGIVDTETVHLAQSIGRVLTQDIVAPVPFPLFDHSAMDGHAGPGRSDQDSISQCLPECFYCSGNSV